MIFSLMNPSLYLAGDEEGIMTGNPLVCPWRRTIDLYIRLTQNHPMIGMVYPVMIQASGSIGIINNPGCSAFVIWHGYWSKE